MDRKGAAAPLWRRLRTIRLAAFLLAAGVKYICHPEGAALRAHAPAFRRQIAQVFRHEKTQLGITNRLEPSSEWKRPARIRFGIRLKDK
jgi:hypothetical protein